MIIKGVFLVVRDNGVVRDAQSIQDCYDEVTVEYYATEEQVIEWGKSVYGKNCYSAISKYLDAVANDEVFTLQGEAKDMPNIGSITVSIEEREIEIV